MALPTVAEIKTYLRVETNAEDILLDDLNKQAVARIETWMGRAITGTMSVIPFTYPSARSLRVGDDGMSSYGVASAVSLDTFPDYALRIEPVLRSAIYDMVADKYFNRNPGRASESASGVSISYNKDGIPMRVVATLHSYRAR